MPDMPILPDGLMDLLPSLVPEHVIETPHGNMNIYKVQFAVDRMKIALAQPLTTLPDYGTSDAVIPREDNPEKGAKLDQLVSELEDVTNELR